MKRQSRNIDKITSEIIRASKSIRKKHLALKLNRSDQDALLIEHFKPVTEPLRKILKDVVAPTIKQETKIEPEGLSKAEVSPTKISSINRGTQVQPNTTTRSSQASDDLIATNNPPPLNLEKSFDQYRNEYQTMLNEQPEIIDEFLEQYNILPRIYLDGLLSDTKGEYDLTTGVHFDPITNQFKIGNSTLEINGPDIVIDDIRYKGSGGLYELIFKATPHGYTIEDEDRYRNILKQTNVHHRDFDPKKQVRGSKSYKYVNIIRPLTHPRASSTSGRIQGGGHLGEELIFNEEPYQYVYWDDVNELVDRLRLLMASKLAGHTGLDNEIASIIEELREIDIIDK